MSESRRSTAQGADGLLGETRQAVTAAQEYLLSIQEEDGHWCGELEGDTILGSEYILAMRFTGQENDARIPKVAEDIRRKQRAGGGWAIYHGGPAEVSASVKAYFVLKLCGDRPDQEHMQRARRTILELGGVEACNSFTKISLAIFGQYDWDKCPAVPPEIMLLPRWFYVNIYEMSSWSRAIVIPLSIIWAHRPSCAIPGHAHIRELFSLSYRSRKLGFWASIFLGLDRGLKLLDKFPIKPSREIAIKKAEQWILTRLDGSDGLGAIFLPIVNTILALRCLGYPNEDPIIQAQWRELNKLQIEDRDTLRIQPCFSPVWDTALAMNALVESGMAPDHPALIRSARWIMDRRGNGSGDWRIKNRTGARPGWYFEYANPFYPDNDTTAMVMTALSKVRFQDRAEDARRVEALREAHEWQLSMQNADGGWAAFDKDCDMRLLCHVPFADHNAMIDPSNEDITARVLETFSWLGYDKHYRPARKAIDYLLRHQAADGSWYGRWGCNYLYGTWLALWGLRCIGQTTHSGWARRAGAWLRRCQGQDGGWGELPISYDDARQKGRGPSTASQTAWATMGLMAADNNDSPSLRRGIKFLLREQREDGSWEEEYWTGTGFPGVFYLRYHLYRVYFPLLALASYKKQLSSEEQVWSRSA